MSFRIDCKPSMLISCTYAFRIKFGDSSSMVAIGNFEILIRTCHNCTILNCCIFAFLVKFYFNSSMAISFASTSIVRFDYNPSMATFCTCLLAFTLFLKTFELDFNLSKEPCPILLNLIFLLEMTC